MNKFIASIIIIVITIIFVIVIFNFYRYYRQFSYKEIFNFQKLSSDHKQIPKILIQTYHDKSKIPKKVYDNIQKYAPEYKHIVYDDKNCIEFLEHFNKIYGDNNNNFDIVHKFNSFKKGAHKADFFRYCYLYHYGGIYLDIKTVLIKPLKDIIVSDNTLYTVVALNKHSIYQGIIAVYPKNPLIGILINQCADCSNFLLYLNYSLFLQFFYKKILEITPGKSVLFSGKQIVLTDYKIHLFEENNYSCENKDRYGLCTFIDDENGNKIFKTRYSDFPW
jgi:hypothetical protein